MPTRRLTLGNARDYIRECHENKRQWGQDIDASAFCFREEDDTTIRTMIVNASRFNEDDGVQFKNRKRTAQSSWGEDDECDNSSVEINASKMRTTFDDICKKRNVVGAVEDMKEFIKERSECREVVEAMRRQEGILGRGKQEVVEDIITIRAGSESEGSYSIISNGDSNYNDSSKQSEMAYVNDMAALFGHPANPSIYRPGQDMLKYEHFLPDAYEGKNGYVNKLIVNLSTEVPDILLNVVCPYRKLESLGTITYQTLQFLPGMLGALPYETTPRLLASVKGSWTSSTLRSGIGECLFVWLLLLMCV